MATPLSPEPRSAPPAVEPDDADGRSTSHGAKRNIDCADGRTTSGRAEQRTAPRTNSGPRGADGGDTVSTRVRAR